MEVPGHDRLLPIAWLPSSRPRGLYLRQRLEIGPTQYETDIGMGHEFAGSVEDVGTSCLADPDLRNDLQDEPEINLCDRDRGRVRAPSHRDSYVRLGGLLAEVHGAEVGFLRLCLDTDRLPRKVWSAAQHIHCQPRHPQSLLPPRIQLAQFGDR